MADFTVNGINYKSQKMPAMQQFHVARRLMPLLSGLSEAFRTGLENPEGAMEIIAGAITKLSDADTEYVLNACLDLTSRQDGQIWSRLRAGNRLMFEDIGMPEMLQIVFNVLQDNFANFLPGLPQQSTPANPA